MKKIIFYLLIIYLSDSAYTQNIEKSNDRSFNHQISSEQYTTDASGNIRMNVNVWGHVNQPGSHLVFEGIDMVTLFSIVGGPKIGADLSKIKIIRELEDHDGRIVYVIDFNDFLSSGNRSTFIKIKPNDTILIPQKFSNIIVNKVGAINTVLGLLTLYLQVKNGL